MSEQQRTSMKRGHDDNDDGNVDVEESLRKRLRENSYAVFDVEKNLKLKNEKRADKFGTVFSSYDLNLTEMKIDSLADAMHKVKTVFEAVIDRVKTPLKSCDLVQLKFQSPTQDFPIKIPLTECSSLSTDQVLNQIEGTIGYKTSFTMDKSLNIEATQVHVPKGGVWNARREVDLQKVLCNSRSVIRILNSDNLCCARAIVTAQAKIEGNPYWNSIRQGYKKQTELAKELHRRAGVEEKQCGIEELKMFQAAMPKYQIHVLSKDSFDDFIYIGPNDGVPIYLYLHDGHFDVITTMTGFLKRNYFCRTCKKGYNDKDLHACNTPCYLCRRRHEDNSEKWTKCDDCNRSFRNASCYEMHKDKKNRLKSTCEIYYSCEKCQKLINRRTHKKEHVCGETFCKTCKDYFEEGHQCYMRVADSRSVSRQVYVFYEFQSSCDAINQCEEGFVVGENNKCVHCDSSTCGSLGYIPNLCVVHKVCTACMSYAMNDNFRCHNCGPHEIVFQGPNTAELFCKWLFSEKNYGVTVLCHNFKGFDSYPVIQYLHRNGVQPKVLKSGCKYTSIKVPKCKMRFLDSQNFITMSRSEMSKSFGEAPLFDGFFPHLFNVKDNQSAVLPCLPDLKYYDPDNMCVDVRKKFLSWYDKHRNDQFDFQKELIAFCKSNVDLVRRCCLNFRSMFMAMSKTGVVNGVDPFEKSVTIAAACNLVYRTKYLQPDTIAIIPTHGYRPRDKQSAMALQWLSYVSHKRNVFIRHCHNRGEKKIGPYKVDGYYTDTYGNRFVLEFHGDFWHGCPNCYARNTMNPVVGKTMDVLYKKTMEKQRFIEQKGYVYESIWECEFLKQVKENGELSEFIKSQELVPPLEPRDAFYGGRTESFRLLETTTEDKKIQYFDFTSLYPFINKTGKVPLGHPKIIKKQFKRLENYEGLIKCKILPPDNLLIPVLPMKLNDKLMFSLCRTCCETVEQTKCTHDDNMRALVGTWVTDEVKTAVANGYTLLKIYEVWHFDRISQYDPATKSGGVFTDYINAYLKLKQESSGWPEHCTTYEEKMAYIRAYEDREGISLDYDNIKKNAGMRSLAKLMLNSFWGKFGQRSNLTKSMYVTKSDTYNDIIHTGKQNVEDIHYVNQETIHVDWIFGDNFIENSSQTNVVIAAYTTAQARLKLFDVLKRLNERVIYCDTDSVVFVTKPGDWEPSLGDFLGEFKDEIAGNEITSFVTAGPKSYAYTLEQSDRDENKSICKVKGLVHNFKNSLRVNYETLYSMITGDRSETIVTTDPYGVRRDPAVGEIVQRDLTKTFQFLFDKRVIVDDISTIPYGFRH